MAALADSAIGTMDWDTAAEGWDSRLGNMTVGDRNPDDWLDINWAADGGGPGPTWYDTATSSASSLYSGSWSDMQTNGMYISFDFRATNVAPQSIRVQWSSSTNSDIWSYNITPPAAGTEWTTLRASFNDWTDWDFPGATEAEFLSDLDDVEWIGVYTFRGSGAAQTYSIDNFMLMIPEPAELLILLLALLLILRDQRKGSHKAAKARRTAILTGSTG